MAKSLYESLGVSKNATQDEIKKAYRKLVREVHPDANPGNEDRFKEVQGAYDVLSDPGKRKQYDTIGSVNGFPGGGANPGGTTFDFGDFDLGDIFGGLFNRGRSGPVQQPQRGQRGNDVDHSERVVPRPLDLSCYRIYVAGWVRQELECTSQDLQTLVLVQRSCVGEKGLDLWFRAVSLSEAQRKGLEHIAASTDSLAVLSLEKRLTRTLEVLQSMRESRI